MDSRTRRWQWTSVVLVLASVGCAATAQDKLALEAQPSAPLKVRTEPSARERIAMEAAFARADADGDGRLSRAESAHLPAIEARFDELDTDHDGYLSIEEFIAGAMVAA